MDIIKSVEHEQLKNKIPDLKIGDTVRVHQKIKEGNRERIAGRKYRFSCSFHERYAANISDRTC